MASIGRLPERIKQRYRAWEDSGLTGLTVRSRQPEAIEVMAEAARLADGRHLAACVRYCRQQASASTPQ